MQTDRVQTEEMSSGGQLDRSASSAERMRRSIRTMRATSQRTERVSPYSGRFCV